MLIEVKTSRKSLKKTGKKIKRGFEWSVTGKSVWGKRQGVWNIFKGNAECLCMLTSADDGLARLSGESWCRAALATLRVHDGEVRSLLLPRRRRLSSFFFLSLSRFARLEHGTESVQSTEEVTLRGPSETSAYLSLRNSSPPPILTIALSSLSLPPVETFLPANRLSLSPSPSFTFSLRLSSIITPLYLFHVRKHSHTIPVLSFLMLPFFNYFNPFAVRF